MVPVVGEVIRPWQSILGGKSGNNRALRQIAVPGAIRGTPACAKERSVSLVRTLMRKVLLLALAVLIPLAGFIYFNNRPRSTSPRGGSPVLLAHRGLAQTFTREDLDAETCTATRIRPPEHPYLENTLPSMEAAFAAGADVVEFDVHPTTDGKFAVFHDWTLDCRTEGKGVTREHTLAELKALDIGYGYTADGGKTFPFRGKGVGLMPDRSTRCSRRFPAGAF